MTFTGLDQEESEAEEEDEDEIKANGTNGRGTYSAANFWFNKGLCMIWNQGTLVKDESC